MEAAGFSLEGTGYYLDKGKWLAINPDKNKTATAKQAFPFPSGRYDVKLQAVGEEDGKSAYTVAVNEQKTGDFECPLSSIPMEEGPSYHAVWKNQAVNSGDIIVVSSTVGWGVEYYFGYKLPQNDLHCQDFRSRDRTWDYCRIALEFFAQNKIPFWEMRNADALVGNAENTNAKFCLAKAGQLYLVYLPNGGTTDLDLAGASGTFAVRWFNPRAGGPLAEGQVKSVTGGGKVALGQPPADPAEDWLVVVRTP